MTNDDHLDRHLALCKRMYMRMLAEGSWPWKEEADSPKTEDVIESEDDHHDI